jgi:hypothetical protein
MRLDRSDPMSNAQEKRVNRIAELKGFRLEKGGHGKGHGRFYIIDLAEGGRMRSGVPEHEYSFSLEEAEAWLAGRSKWPAFLRPLDNDRQRIALFSHLYPKDRDAGAAETQTMIDNPGQVVPKQIGLAHNLPFIPASFFESAC